MSETTGADQEPPRAAVRLAHEIRSRRRAAGLSQPQLATLIGYTRQYVSMAERPGQNLPSMGLVSAIDDALHAGGALRELRNSAKSEQVRRRRPQAPVGPLTGTGSRPGSIRYVDALVADLHRGYQAARYDSVRHALPEIKRMVDGLLTSSHGDEAREALRSRCGTAVVEAKAATKLGDGVTAYEAAVRALDAADQAETMLGHAAASYQLTCALLKLGAADEAEDNAIESARRLHRDEPGSISWRGSLSLISAIIAARHHDAALARRRLDHAEELALRLGRDDNLGFSAFGPTNVRIHCMSAAVALDDPSTVLAVGEQLDLSALPAGLHGRRAQAHVDNAWAFARRTDDAPAVIHLLEAERVAPELLKANRTARTVITTLLGRERRHAMPGLRELANRTGVHG
ncbi:helix-turn-helix transcriptional regulator [Saccharothrix australiensis]|uniref:DNA-binding XRE family transcriptional regulator n=1 Tax=Saccharothrix australiensis TaxID=2072 RepID=A0A495W6H7_9PSEU|nr:helix-turn-helix transcriptional regulator [Saccharothrix australiensis]RKT55408.1 DNA-binding XRE family transcriptional regulator [Saccharothrix australiensis]